jgi:hypothetical protein
MHTTTLTPTARAEFEQSLALQQRAQRRVTYELEPVWNGGLLVATQRGADTVPMHSSLLRTVDAWAGYAMFRRPEVLTQLHTRTGLTKDERREIVRRYTWGESRPYIARIFGCNERMVAAAIKELVPVKQRWEFIMRNRRRAAEIARAELAQRKERRV